MHDSYWRRSVSLPHREPLERSIHREVVILGGGMAGCLLGFRLVNLGFSAVILEANTIGGGQTGSTTAKITAQHGLLSQVVETAGLERARAYVMANQLGVKEFGALAARLSGDIGWEQCPSYVYSRPGGPDLRQEADTEAALGLPSVFTRDTALPFPISGAVRLDSQAVFHPLAFLQAITGSLEIYEHTQAVAIHGNRVYTPKGSVTGEKIVFACHYPFRNVPGFYFLKMNQGRDYVVAMEQAAALDGSYWGAGKSDLSLRNAGTLLLAGGGNHLTGKHPGTGSYGFLEQETAKFWPERQIAFRWSAQDCMTPDGIPYVGRYSLTKPDWYVATGFNRWGMTNSMAASMILSDLLAEQENGFAWAFDPRRHNGATWKGMGKQTVQAVSSLSKQLLSGKKETKCAHLGCQMQWNPDEETWDCPCHGSRFHKDGARINGPAQKDRE